MMCGSCEGHILSLLLLSLLFLCSFFVCVFFFAFFYNTRRWIPFLERPRPIVNVQELKRTTLKNDP